MSKIYVVSDIHGKFIEFIDLFSKLDIKKEDTLVVNGDIIDRGEDSALLVDFILNRENTEFIIGNHEDMFMKVYDKELFSKIYLEKGEVVIPKELLDNEKFEIWQRNGAIKTIKSFVEFHNRLNIELFEKFYNYLKNAKYYKIVEKNIICHGGIKNLKNSYDNREEFLKDMESLDSHDLVWDRTICIDAFKEGIVNVPKGYTLIIGHTPNINFLEQGKEIKDTIYKKGDMSDIFDIDFGTYKKGAIGILELDTYTVWVYYSMLKNNKLFADKLFEKFEFKMGD